VITAAQASDYLVRMLHHAADEAIAPESVPQCLQRKGALAGIMAGAALTRLALLKELH